MSIIAVRGPVPRLSGRAAPLLAAPLLAALMLAACHLSAAVGGSSGTPRAAPYATTSSPPKSYEVKRETDPPSDAPNESGLPMRPDQATPLTGYSVEEATRRARAKGFHGSIEIVPLAQFDEACKPATVCAIRPWYWEHNNTELTLYINREPTTTPPRH